MSNRARALAWRGIVLFLLAFWAGVAVLLLSGCNRAPDAPAPRAAVSSTSGDTSPPTADTTGEDIPVFTDRFTGCQYLGYTGHGLTPRMSRYVDGKQAQMGCYVTEHQP